MIALRQQGHRVISLSQSTGAQVHDHVRQYGVETFSYMIKESPRWLWLLRHAVYLVRFCAAHKVGVMYSHLEGPAFVSTLVRPFVRARVFVCRHHVDEARLRGFDRAFYYRFTYRFAYHVIVVSARAKEYMIREEGVPAEKITHINLAYDFDEYTEPAAGEVERVAARMPGKVRLLTVGRLTKYKRPEAALFTLKELRTRGVDAGLTILGRGEEEANLKGLAGELGIEKHVLFDGYVERVVPYMKAANFLVHASELESSCVVVKEAALAGLPVIVCSGIGDFDEYLENERDAFVLDPSRFVEMAANVIGRNHSDIGKLRSMAERLAVKVRTRFDIRTIVAEYGKLTGNA
jgi:glycosyltransferase involved in cell wall biosynthesis